MRFKRVSAPELPCRDPRSLKCEKSIMGAREVSIQMGRVADPGEAVSESKQDPGRQRRFLGHFAGGEPTKRRLRVEARVWVG